MTALHLAPCDASFLKNFPLSTTLNTKLSTTFPLSTLNSKLNNYFPTLHYSKQLSTLNPKLSTLLSTLVA